MRIHITKASRITAIYVWFGYKTRTFESFDDAFYFLWHHQRTYPNTALGIWDGRTLYSCVARDITALARSVLGFDREYRFDSLGYIETGYYWDCHERGDVKRFVQCRDRLPLAMPQYIINETGVLPPLARACKDIKSPGSRRTKK